MRGTYVLKVDGEEVGRYENLITIEGERTIAAYLAGLVPSWAGAIAVGSGAALPADTDEILLMEFDRQEVTAMAVLYGGGAGGSHRIIAKATIPAQVAGSIREIGVYSVAANVSGSASAQLLAGMFEEDWEVYSGGSWIDIATVADTTYARIGTDAVKLETNAATTNYRLNTGNLDLSMYTSTDKFTFAAYYTTGTVTSVGIKFYTDDSNYFSYSPAVATIVGGAANTYTISSYTKSLFTATGTPDWANISSIGIDVGSAGVAAIAIDGIRVDDADSSDSDIVLVSHSVLGVPKTKAAGSEMDIEYFLDL
jgi:hypothetical protein